MLINMIGETEWHLPRQPGTDLEIFDRGGLIDYPMGLYQNPGHSKKVAN